MIDITRRRSLATAAAALALRPAVGDDTFPTAPTAADGPVMLTACPATNARPRDLDAYRAACAAASGRPVAELDAVEAQPGMSLWHLGSFRPITDVQRDGNAVLLWLLGDGVTPSRYASLDAPLYRLA